MMRNNSNLDFLNAYALQNVVEFNLFVLKIKRAYEIVTSIKSYWNSVTMLQNMTYNHPNILSISMNKQIYVKILSICSQVINQQEIALKRRYKTK